MVRFWAIRLGLGAGIMGLLGSFGVQLLAFGWPGLAQYAPGLMVFNLALLGVVGLALALVLAPRRGGPIAGASAWPADYRRRRPLESRPARRVILRRLAREWPLVVLGILFVHLLLNLGLGDQADPTSVFWQLYLLRVQSTSWMILYFVPVAVVGSHVFRSTKRHE